MGFTIACVARGDGFFALFWQEKRGVQIDAHGIRVGGDDVA